MADAKKPTIYFDHAATTLPYPEVGPLFCEVISRFYANPSSNHALGNEASRYLNGARKEILDSFKMKNHQVIFTSGATESNNLALKGYMNRYKNRGKHLIISAIEHPSIMNAANALIRDGFDVTILPVGQNGKISINGLKSAIRKDTTLVSIMAVNNEVGIVQPLKDIIDVVKAYPNVALHVDAVQAVGKIELPYNDIDMVTVSMHKIGGNKGSGLLLKRNNIELIPLNDGGGHEYGYRSGTNDLANAVVDNFVIKKALKNIKENYATMYKLVKPLYDYLFTKQDEIVVNSYIINPYIVNFSFVHKKASVFAEYFSNNGIMVSTHSACSSKLDNGSPTLSAMGLNTVLSKNSIRLSFALSNTKEEIDRFIALLDYGLEKIRG